MQSSGFLSGPPLIIVGHAQGAETSRGPSKRNGKASRRRWGEEKADRGGRGEVVEENTGEGSSATEG